MLLLLISVGITVFLIVAALMLLLSGKDAVDARLMEPRAVPVLTRIARRGGHCRNANKRACSSSGWNHQYFQADSRSCVWFR